jgi:NAD-dependent DNA ligase
MHYNSLDWIWDDKKKHIKINNNNNKYLLIKNIYYFFSTLETKGLGEKIIEKLVNHGLDSIYKIITVNKDKLILIEGIKEKSAINILNAIQKSLINIPLYKLMAASNKLGNGIGQEKIKLILNVYPNIINDYSLINLNKLINIKGWDEKTASLFLNNFPNFIKFYNEIKKFITIEQTKLINSILSNIIIVLSGFRDKQLQDKIIKNGGTIGATLTKKTNYLIVKDKTIITDKISKAEELNINILTIDEFLRKYKLTILI